MKRSLVRTAYSQGGCKSEQAEHLDLDEESMSISLTPPTNTTVPRPISRSSRPIANSIMNRALLAGISFVVMLTWVSSNPQQLLFVSGFSSSPATIITSRPLKGSQLSQQQQQQQHYGFSQLSVASSNTEQSRSSSNPSTSSNTIQPPKSKQQQQQPRGYKSHKKGYKKKGNKGGRFVGSTMNFNAARNYNSELTKCNSVSELLTSFMGQTSSSSNEPASAATHLAGANKVNSVNFSTCLHRLARFAAKGNQLEEERKLVLSDPRFALLVCSMAEMASGCDASTSIKEGNGVVERWNTAVSEMEFVSG
eukprot:CAMPEP_0201922128 /NCGR_PEP_ID=MMETSP0903-20130614/10249_1 /ASSEMBLY_ACC=CAM_ASM_000552 /TAXON_ID=420261 /ORGANISM="Thalassiosira antarctica, Strain CCMP982" /LENGTH=307 /DNA_ID=CAMNT_0048459205 /DNA_START=89 /DNA_END=1009 /DNA_ORIENTATION=-